MSKIAVIGSGFSGLSAAAYLAKAGHEVHVFEKHSTAGGRARQLITDNGYTFDMGPSWYWMPDVFEKFFGDFGQKVSNLYFLELLSPAFEVVFEGQENIKIPSSFDELVDLFESIEKGAGEQLHLFMKDAKEKYEFGIENLVYKPGISIMEYTDLEVIKGALRMRLFSSFSKHVRNYFKNPKLISLMEFPVLFLGAMPAETPALYSLMNYAGLKLGTWYPHGGFGAVVEAMVRVAKLEGVKFHFNSSVNEIVINDLEKSVSGIKVDDTLHHFDGAVASADYNHVEQKLLPERYRNYTEKYWDKKTFSPSCLIYYIGVSKIIPSLEHHTLFFDEDLDLHAREIYKDPQWPHRPLFYVCCPSKTDSTVAPAGHENIFLLMPIAPGLKDNEETRAIYFNEMMTRLEKKTGENIRDFIEYKKSYCVNDFITDYNSYKGNAYGLANTLAQTAILKPGIRNNKLKNLFYTGQLTVPGPGVPPSLISGKIAAEQICSHFKKHAHEVTL